MRGDFAAFTCFVAVSVLNWTVIGSSIPVTRCSPASHICQGRCPALPAGAELPSDQEEGLCLKDRDTDACVCWLPNPASSSEQHFQTLFKCEMKTNNTLGHVMCLPPQSCFPPDLSMSCMIVLQCPCMTLSRLTSGHPWYRVVAIVLRSRTPVPQINQGKEGSDSERPQSDVREFSVKHLLFLLAFVIAPLLCWCLLTFFHEGKCRKKRRRRSPEAEPMPTERVEEVVEEAPPTGSCPPPAVMLSQQLPTAPKFESPPPYGEALDPGESCLLAGDCGPPPSYEDAIRDQHWQVAVHRIQDV